MAATGDVAVERRPDGDVVVRIAGRWHLGRGVRATDDVNAALGGPPPARAIAFDAAALTGWDSSLVVFVARVVARGQELGIAADTGGLPDGVRRLLALSDAALSQHPPPTPAAAPWLARFGTYVLDRLSGLTALLRFVGELTASLVRLVSGHARVRAVDVLAEVESAGARSLGIIAVVSLLLGMILAFVGGVTLRPFGATIYVADLVTIAIVRELGPIMTAILMAGHTGSAYAAQLGTMRVTQELDALTTMALPPSDFLVVPRVLALSLMLPLLVVYADFIALAGGAIVATGSGTGLVEYVTQAQASIGLRTFWIGVAKSVVFGIIVALCGCLHGMRASRSAAAVGTAATRAVVDSIVWIIVADGVFAFILALWDI
jgi:phospholipid/cholesterol/gamma-HCH transport system permease protein